MSLIFTWHLSAGKKDENFTKSQDAFRSKIGRSALAPRWMQTTCANSSRQQSFGAACRPLCGSPPPQRSRATCRELRVGTAGRPVRRPARSMTEAAKAATGKRIAGRGRDAVFGICVGSGVLLSLAAPLSRIGCRKEISALPPRSSCCCSCWRH